MQGASDHNHGRRPAPCWWQPATQTKQHALVARGAGRGAECGGHPTYAGRGCARRPPPGRAEGVPGPSRTAEPGRGTTGPRARAGRNQEAARPRAPGPPRQAARAPPWAAARGESAAGAVTRGGDPAQATTRGGPAEGGSERARGREAAAGARAAERGRSRRASPALGAGGEGPGSPPGRWPRAPAAQPHSRAAPPPSLPGREAAVVAARGLRGGGGRGAGARGGRRAEPRRGGRRRQPRLCVRGCLVGVGGSRRPPRGPEGAAVATSHLRVAVPGCLCRLLAFPPFFRRGICGPRGWDELGGARWGRGVSRASRNSAL